MNDIQKNVNKSDNNIKDVNNVINNGNYNSISKYNKIISIFWYVIYFFGYIINAKTKIIEYIFWLLTRNV